MKEYAFFERGGYVSIWIGRLSSDVELDEYLNMTSEFEMEFGFKLDEANMPETSVETEAVPVSRLIDGFSWSESYQDAAAKAAIKLGYEFANTLVVFHNFKYDPTAVKVQPSSKLVFLGAFPFGQVP